MTTSIQNLDASLAYQLSDTDERPASPGSAGDQVAIRVCARALEGMQKEAIVVAGDGLPAWRLVCDEGHYLNGTDLAPPPLAFFSAGMASIYMTAIARALSHASRGHLGITLEQDACYGMEGSALRGTMTASADSVVLRIALPEQGSGDDLKSLVATAIARTPVDLLMRKNLRDTFSIMKNGDPLDTGAVAQSTTPNPGDPAALFDQLDRSRTRPQVEAVVSKLESAESVFEEDHGVGAALKEEQKRLLLIRSRAVIREDGLQQISVQIHRPIGSLFQFLVDEAIDGNGGERAPNGLSYVSAGIAFCYMTQLGRYVQITKKEVANYRIVQSSCFEISAGDAHPVDTHVYLESSEDAATCRQIVDMAEQTCFLHAACRMSNKTRLQVSKPDTTQQVSMKQA